MPAIPACSLFAEALGPAGEHPGDSPRAFTCPTLISAAHHLDRALSQGRRRRGVRRGLARERRLAGSRPGP